MRFLLDFLDKLNDRLSKRHLKAERDRLEAERNYLLLWLGGHWKPLRGLSADALTRVALGDETPHSYPHDAGDLARCERAFEKMPPHLQQRALPVLQEWREIIAQTEQKGNK